MTYALKATVAVQANPVPVLYSNGSIWVGNFNSDSVSRIDPVTNAVTATITNAGFFDRPVAFAEDDLGNVWVACQGFFDGSVSRIDPATDTVTANLYTTDGLNPIGLGMGAGEMWVSFNQGTGRYRRFNTSTLLTTYTSPTGLSYGYNFADDGTNVWIYSTSTGFLHKIDPATNTVTTVSTGILTGHGQVRYAFGYIWHITTYGIQRIDPSTNAVTTATLSTSSIQGLTDDGTHIITGDDTGKIYVVDPATLAVKQTVTGGGNQDMDFDGTSIWVNSAGVSTGNCKKFSPLAVGWVRGHAWG